MNSCIICGTPCKSKYCSESCAKEGVRITRRISYRKTHPAYENFYVFYDKNDFVKFFGTSEQLISDGVFPTKNAVLSYVSKIKSGAILNGSVFILKCKKEV